MASQIAAILLLGTLQNAHRIKRLTLTMYRQFNIADRSFAAGGRPADRRSAKVSATSSAGTFARSPIGAGPQSHKGVHQRNMVWLEV